MSKKIINHRKIAEAITGGGTWLEALMDGGYSRSVAQRGEAGMSQSSRDKLTAEMKKAHERAKARFQKLGLDIKPDEQESLVRGALVSNVLEGKDKATASLKMLGSDRRVNMWQPENAAGVIVIQATPVPALNSVPRWNEELKRFVSPEEPEYRRIGDGN